MDKTIPHECCNGEHYSTGRTYGGKTMIKSRLIKRMKTLNPKLKISDVKSLKIFFGGTIKLSYAPKTDRHIHNTIINMRDLKLSIFEIDQLEKEGVQVKWER